MSVNLSPVAGAAAQFLDNNGNVLTGGKLFTYLAGTTTPAATYTSSAGAIFHSNPIILDAAGRVQSGGEIWLSDNIQYKFVLKDANDVLIASWDNLSGINSNFVNYTVQEEVQTATAGQTVFNLSTVSYAPGTNSLSVYVDGVNQYEGSTYSFVETNATTVTFTSGLHVGALVKFTTAVPATGTATNANVVTYDPAGAGAVPITVEDKLRQIVSVKDFGAVGDGVVDDTAAIQAALDHAKITRQAVYAPAGVYSITQIAIPSGIQFYGDGVGGYGAGVNPSFPYDATVFFQPNGVNDDAIVFDCPFQSGQWRLFHNYIHDFIVLKAGFPTTDTIGNGISARQVGLDRNVDANHTLVNGITVFARILVRGFPENGMFFKRGAVPLYCYDLDFIFNAGYGLRLDGTNYSRNIIFRNLAGDGNKAGATVYIAGNLDSQVTLDGIYGEYRSDAPAGNTSGFNGAQPRAIEIGNFGVNSSVYIANVLQESIVTNEASEACIYVNTTTAANTPKITFNTCVISDLTALSGGKNIIKDARTGKTISSKIPSGQYNVNLTTGDNNLQIVPSFVSSGNDFVRPATGDFGFQSYGTLPITSWYETDAAADTKGWLLGPSGGNLFLRTFSDDGFTTDIALTIARTGNAVTQFQFQKPVVFNGGVALPTYANNAAALAGGLVATQLYKTSTGEVRIVV